MVDKKNQQKNAPPIENTDNQAGIPMSKTREEENEEKLSQLLSGLQRGWKVVIVRMQPSWCKGYLETIDVVDGQPIDMEYLITTWGGQRLNLKVHDEKGLWIGGGWVDLFTWEPKKYGKVITPGTEMISPNPQPVPATPNIDMTKIFELMTKSASRPTPVPDNNSDMMLKLFELMMLQQQQQRQPALMDPNKQLASTLEMMAKMKEVMGGFGQQAPASSGDEMMPMIADLVKGMMANKPAPKAAITPPVSPPSPPSPPQLVSVPGNQNPGGVKSLESLAREFSGLSAADAADVVTMVFGDMPEAKRERATQHFMSNLSGDESYDDAPEEDVDNNTNPLNNEVNG